MPLLKHDSLLDLLQTLAHLLIVDFRDVLFVHLLSCEESRLIRETKAYFQFRRGSQMKASRMAIIDSRFSLMTYMTASQVKR